LIASAATRQPYGGRPAGSCSHLMHWIGENRKSELAVRPQDLVGFERE